MDADPPCTWPREPPPDDDEGEYDLSQLSDPEEDEEEPEEIEAAPPPVREPDPSATMPKRRGRQPKPREPKPVGVGATVREPLTYWKQRNIEVLWPEVLEYLRQQHHSPYDVDIRVKRTEPIEMLIGQPFNGGTVVGGEGRAASTAIVDKITDEYHMVSGAVGPATYKIEIFWRVNAKVLTWGTLRLNSPDAIMGMRRQQQQQQPPPWQGPHYLPPPPYAGGYGAPPPPPPPMYPPPYAGYGAPPPQTPVHDDVAAALRAENGYLKGTLDEVMRAFREGRQPNIQPMPATGVGAPAQSGHREHGSPGGGDAPSGVRCDPGHGDANRYADADGVDV